MERKEDTDDLQQNALNIMLASEGFTPEKRHSSKAVAPIEDLAYRHNPLKKRKAISTVNIRVETFGEPPLTGSCQTKTISSNHTFEKDFQKMEIISEKVD